MDNLIGLINDLQDAFAGVDDRFALDLPQIAVVGSQSAGKSSVLENIVGKDFLPRGSGIVTRRPLILQLIRDPTAVEGSEYGEFLHRRQQFFHDFNSIRNEIEMETERVCGANKGISHAPIHLRVHSARVLDLTLIDLPGMTKVPVGDQPPDIEIQIRQLILEFIENPNCLILAVTPANADLANSDALQMALNVDPDGSRTIGVLTKLDLMDQGTDARSILQNELYPLRYGYIGIVNRSQKDIDGRKDIDAALRSEEEFFSSHPSYSDMKERLGTTYLQKALHFHLTRHIAETLPDLRASLHAQMNEVERRLGEMKPGCADVYDYDDPYWKPKTLVTSVINFSQHCRVDLLGNSNDNDVLRYDRLSSGARIQRLFQVAYPALMADVEFAKEVEMKREIGYAIQNVIGVRTSLFTPDKAFDQIVRKQIHKLREPTTTLIEMTSSEIMRAIDFALEPLNRFPTLAKEMQSRVSTFVLERVQYTRDAVGELLDYEHAYINAKHDDFVGFTYAERTAERIVRERKNPGQQVLKSGWLSMSTASNVVTNLLRDRKYWFVLTPDNLSWYTDPTLQECKYRVPVNGERLIFIDRERNNEFSLAYEAEKRNVYKDCHRIDFTAPSFEQFEQWRVGFMRVGVFGSSTSSATSAGTVTSPISAQILNVDDPHLERQIEIIWVLIASYMRIVCRTLEDMVPKAVVCVLIKDTIEYLEKRFVADVSRLQNVDELLEENTQVVQARQQLQKRARACRFALEKLQMVHVPKMEGIFYDAAAVKKPSAFSRPADRGRPTIPPRPVGLKPATAQEPQAPKRSGSVPSMRKKLAETNATATTQAAKEANRKSSLNPQQNAGPSAADADQYKRRTSYRAPKTAAGQLKKAQQQIDSSQKSMFYVV